MKFNDFVCADSIKVDLSASDKEGVICELVDCLIGGGHIESPERDNIVQAIMKREELGSTGIGRRSAVPHTKHPSVQRPMGTVGISRSGVEFQSLDGESVQLFFLLISPPDRPGDHLRALEYISKQLDKDTFRRFLSQCQTASEVQQLLEEADNNLLPA
ncbi:MAG TPA: PTS sugar transporter subunit IIA [Pirellulaceae bacterium]|nr:PTS sugar transporter subunit IIA [Pirellulaceae bacterium]